MNQIFNRQAIARRSSFGDLQQKSDQSQSGFTLIELLVIVVIVGAMASIAAPGWLAFRNRIALGAAQDQALQMMQQAKDQAARSRTNWQASFRQTPDGIVQGAYHNIDTPPEQASWQNFDQLVQIDPDNTTMFLQDDVYQMQFNHRGASNGQLGRITFESSESGNSRRCVIVSTLLGTMRLEKENSPADDECSG